MGADMTSPGQPDRATGRRAAVDAREIATGLRDFYAGVVDEPLGPRMAELLARLDRVDPSRSAPRGAERGV
jgi:hypothetical protein